MSRIFGLRSVEEVLGEDLRKVLTGMVTTSVWIGLRKRGGGLVTHVGSLGLE